MTPDCAAATPQHIDPGSHTTDGRDRGSPQRIHDRDGAGRVDESAVTVIVVEVGGVGMRE